MKVLSLTQPWATLVAIGAKTIETRSWATRYRGPLAIHAAKGLGSIGGPLGLMALCRTEPFHCCLVAAGYTGTSQLPFGAIVAVCTLDDCFQFTSESTANLSAQELAFGDYTPGRYGFRLSNIRQLDAPIPARGSLGLWNYEGEL